MQITPFTFLQHCFTNRLLIVHINYNLTAYWHKKQAQRYAVPVDIY